MKNRLFIFSLMVMVGISLFLFNFSTVKADESRTIPKKHAVAKGANKLVIGHGGTLYRVDGYASSASCFYSVHDSSAIGGTGTTNQGTVDNALAEGGEASQYDSFPSIDFGEEGIPFTYGLVIMTTVCDVSVTYN